jgi:hypothetical protein
MKSEFIMAPADLKAMHDVWQGTCGDDDGNEIQINSARAAKKNQPANHIWSITHLPPQ